MADRKTLTIFSAKIAKDLIHNGFMIVNLKPNSRNTDRTVFYFALNDELKEFLKKRHPEVYQIFH